MRKWICGVLVAAVFLLAASWMLDKPLTRNVLGVIDVAWATDVPTCGVDEVYNPVTRECECECNHCDAF